VARDAGGGGKKVKTHHSAGVDMFTKKQKNFLKKFECERRRRKARK